MDFTLGCVFTSHKSQAPKAHTKERKPAPLLTIDRVKNRLKKPTTFICKLKPPKVRPAFAPEDEDLLRDDDAVIPIKKDGIKRKERPTDKEREKSRILKHPSRPAADYSIDFAGDTGESEYPESTPLLAKILESMLSRSEAGDKISHHKKITDAANEVISSVDVDLLARFLVQKKEPEDEEADMRCLIYCVFLKKIL
ncbi:unnamed protein product [Eruca vesicaria subsp. sativa]|uniref:Uncharacterized protein n=1 Tax=Eruca vesicaria subsp. sativa TaxID=29727 RepID=A0ABC8M335_ERUVS|nr:unnamed protein product [Eruca vesicaria subsp. sativa]